MPCRRREPLPFREILRLERLRFQQEDNSESMSHVVHQDTYASLAVCRRNFIANQSKAESSTRPRPLRADEARQRQSTASVGSLEQRRSFLHRERRSHDKVRAWQRATGSQVSSLGFCPPMRPASFAMRFSSKSGWFHIFLPELTQ